MLHDLTLDYCRPPLPLPRAGWALLAAGVTALAASAGWTWRLEAQLASTESEVRTLERAAAAAARDAALRSDASDAERARRVEVGRANALLRALNMPWEDLFRAIEASARDDVALLQLQPDPQKGTVRITAEARDFAAVVAYSDELSRRPPFASVMLQSHEEDARGKVLRFTLVARWKVQAS